MKKDVKKEETFFGMSTTRVINAQQAWLAGKNPKITVRNPDSSDTSRMYVRMHSNDVWGKPRKPPVLKFSDNDLSDLPDKFQDVKKSQR